MNKFFNGLRAASLLLFALFSISSTLASNRLNVWLECPPNVTINCTESISDLDKWGKLWIWEDYVKKQGPSPKEVIYNLNACGIGEILRKWEYEDKHWNIHTCTQTIVVKGLGTLFSEIDITWPPSYEIEGCNPNADPKSLPKPYNYPSFRKINCSQPMYSYSDMKFNIAEGCMKILRQWKVIDWCQYVPNSKDQKGLWTYTQVIKLIAKDSLAHLICPKDTVVLALQDCKGVQLKLDSVYGFSKCGAITKISNNSPYSTSKGSDASGFYPIGTTKFYFYGEYGCGKQVSCSLTVQVINKVQPTPYCLTGVITTLMPVDSNKDGTPEDGMIEVWAKDLDHGSFSKCGYKKLNFSFSKDTNDKSRIFTCKELGKNNVEIWVTDSFGNQSFCKTMIEIQNNNAQIPDCKRDSFGGPEKKLLIAGILQTVNQKNINDVKLSLTQFNTPIITEKRDTIIEIRYDTIIRPSGSVFFIQRKDTSIKITYDTIKATVTSAKMNNKDGSYAFNNLNSGNDYMLLPSCDIKDLSGIDSEDVIALLKHILGIEVLKSPYQRLAADLNCDGQISNSDFDLLMSLNNKSRSPESLPKMWRFIPKDLVINNTLKNMEEYINYKNLTGNINNANFIGIKLGDLNQSFGKFNTTSQRTNTSYFATSNTNQFLANIPQQVQFTFDQTYPLLQLHLSDSISIINVDDQWGYDSKRNIIWPKFQDHEITLSLSCRRDINIAEELIQNLFTTIEGVSISIIGQNPLSKDFDLIEIYPNPVQQGDLTTISMLVKNPDVYKLKVFDLQGRILSLQSKYFENGLQQWTIDLNELSNSSVYMIELTSPRQTEVRKTILSK